MRQLVLFLLVCPALCAVARADILAVNIHGQVFDIDSKTGTGVTVGPTGFLAQNSMAEHEGVYYSIGGGGIITVDPITGAGTFVVAQSPRNLSIAGLAMSPSGVMHLVRDGGSTASDEIWTIDLTTGVGTLVGAMGHSTFQSLAFDAAGTLYTWSKPLGLCTVNTATGLATDVNPSFGGGGVDIQTIDFAPDGTLYGARDVLYEIDVSTGVPTAIGSGGFSNVRGIAATGSPPTAGELLDELIGDIGDLDLPHGTENSLLAKLNAAVQALEQGNEQTALNLIEAFINAVSAQSGKKIPVADANAIIEKAQEILALIEDG